MIKYICDKPTIFFHEGCIFNFNSVINCKVVDSKKNIIYKKDGSSIHPVPAMPFTKVLPHKAFIIKGLFYHSRKQSIPCRTLLPCFESQTQVKWEIQTVTFLFCPKKSHLTSSWGSNSSSLQNICLISGTFSVPRKTEWLLITGAVNQGFLREHWLTYTRCLCSKG